MVQRSTAFDPPEYVAWKANPALMQEWEATLSASKPRRSLVEALTPQAHLDLFAGLLRTRFMDTWLKRWVKQGVISKAWLGTGEEAVTIGSVHALRTRSGRRRRGAGHSQCRRLPRNGHADVGDVQGLLGHARSTQQGTRFPHRRHESGRHPADQHARDAWCRFAPVSRSRSSSGGEDRIALTWVGDGSTRTGDFHEGMSMAAALQVPMVVFVQNNQVALGHALRDPHPRAVRQTARGVRRQGLHLRRQSTCSTCTRRACKR